MKIGKSRLIKVNKVEYRLIKFASQLKIYEQKIKNPWKTCHPFCWVHKVYGVNDRLYLTIILLLKKILKKCFVAGDICKTNENKHKNWAGVAKLCANSKEISCKILYKVKICLAYFKTKFLNLWMLKSFYVSLCSKHKISAKVRKCIQSKIRWT